MYDNGTGGSRSRPTSADDRLRLVSMQLPNSVLDALDEAADARGTSRQALVAEICRQWLAREEQR